MATYVPVATQTTEPTSSQTVESAALEFRTLKTRVNALEVDLDVVDASLDTRLDLVEATLLSTGLGGTPGVVYIERFSGDGVSLTLALSVTPVVVNVVDVYIGGVYQNHDTFSVSGTTLTFTEAPVVGTNNIEVRISVPLALGATADASAVNYFPAGTGAVATTVQTKLRESVSVKDFGAVGDGVTDDTAAIQAAFAVAGYIYIPDGTYIVDPLSVASNTTIMMGPNAILKAKAGYGVNDRLLNIIDVSDVEIRGGTVQMLRAEYIGVVNEQRHGIIISGATNVKLIGVTSIDSGGDGIYVGGANPCVNVLLEDCVSDNHFRNSLSITRGDGITVLRGKYANANGTTEAPAGPWAGIDVEPNAATTLDNVVIDGAECYSNNGQGILSSGPSAALIISLIIRNCNIHDNLLQGIKPSYTQYCEITNNNISANGGSGIEDTTTTATHQQITGNVISNSGGYGIKGFCSNSLIADNQIYTSGSWGIYWQYGQHVSISGNIVNDSTEAGIFYERAYNCTISGNTVKNTQKHGIYVTGTVTSSVTRSRKVAISGNTVAFASLLTDNTYSGIYLDTYANTSVITGNTVVCGTAGNLPLHAIYAVDTTVYAVNNQTDGGCKSGNAQVNVGGVAPASFLNSPNILPHTYVTGRLLFSGQCYVSAGTGTPEGAVSAVVGSLFLRTDGGASTTLYVKQSGAGNTGWVAK